MPSRLGLVCLALVLVLGPSCAARAQVPPRRAPAANASGDTARRKQLADQLQRDGVDVDWRTASVDELEDWSQRIAETRTLKDFCAMQVDWRTYSLDELKDSTGRCAKGARLGRAGVQVDWKKYSNQQLDDLLLFVNNQMDKGGNRSAAPILPEGNGGGIDPDAILKPDYVGEDGARATRPLPIGRRAATPDEGAPRVGAREPGARPAPARGARPFP
ncbi:MAG TPA: hypothetical protein VHJ20_06085, partial [Polyangia bacterium]|nr:hypothetical protein [Polyangia bacterium]